MKITYLTDIRQFNRTNLTLALGYFDGVHLGHVKVLSEAVRIAKETNTISTVLTFSSSIKYFLENKKEEYLTSINDKIDLFKEIGIEEVIFVNLNHEFVSLTDNEFFDIFLKNVNHVVCGFDYTFGAFGKGNVDTLKMLLKDKLTVIDKLEIGGVKVGTKEIAYLIKSGKMRDAKEYLGREYMVEAKLYKRNKYFAINTSSYVLPKNGYYNLTFLAQGIIETLTSKIKLIDPSNGLLLKETDNLVLEKLFKATKHFKVIFAEIDWYNVN